MPIRIAAWPLVSDAAIRPRRSADVFSPLARSCRRLPTGVLSPRDPARKPTSIKSALTASSLDGATLLSSSRRQASSRGKTTPTARLARRRIAIVESRPLLIDTAASGSPELPLFAPPQMPAATSNPSVSPARRVEHHRPSLPFVHPGQNPFTNPRPMQSPQNSHAGPAFSGLYTTPAPHGHRSRGSIGYVSNGSGSGAGLGVLPTPDPTVGSCMSEEDKDVAIQLMRLGESSNVSHGRTSASTLDDTFSGKADAASSTGATSDGESESEDELPAARRQKLDAPDGAKRIYQTTEAHFIPTTEVVGGGDAKVEDGAGTPAVEGKPFPARKQPAAKQKSASAAPKAATQKAKAARPAGLKTKKASAPPASATSGPMSPASTTHSRKPSVASVGHVAQAGGEEDHPDLSTKPRCQRCRKSKKGCDRQRPCGRCRDAGLSADQCISEDEGNGRKGRYGRHMGVPLKKDEAQALTQPALLPAAPITMAASTTTDKARKRKR
ncbi:hypothetical protein DCS_07628 [Drechmeria coniospora]|uniref:Zn(2)-C6 fungal-type domain-containing protein n=1 Tax=Drechmeria coniospora TaxID=98403 RepID=A0A151GEZ6_DRECN|nr:hypothetical protein DCS_07628 [Drechmeria coniospora]KYK55664.1 hypothetical protein DCS_07628 [Drechmeria coniospora]